MIALMISWAPPYVMAAAMAKDASMACHRPALAATPVAHHHCHDMADMGDQESTAGVEGVGAAMSATPEKCPMQCCTAMRSANQAFPVAPGPITGMPVIEVTIPVVKIVFIRSGFSSHTDRGPPIA